MDRYELHTIVHFPFSSSHYTTHISFNSLYPVQWSSGQISAAEAKATQTKLWGSLGWTHRYKNSTVVFMNWLTNKKYSFLKGLCIFSLLPRFFPLYHQQDFDWTWLLVTHLVSCMKQELLSLLKLLCSPPAFWWNLRC